MFNEHEIEFLSGLRGYEVWNSILTKLTKSEVLRWKEGKSSEKWAYDTGRHDENNDLIQLLRGKQ